MKRCSTLLAFRETKIRITVSYHYTPVRTGKIKNTDSAKCWQRHRKTVSLIHCWWKQKIVQPLWKRVRQFPKNLPYDLALSSLLLPSHSLPLFLPSLPPFFPHPPFLSSPLLSSPFLSSQDSSISLGYSVLGR